ncbi:MAG: hypothetical protein ABEJ28_09825 [Salinigranum sp.]
MPESKPARMELTPDAIREQDDGYYVECPSCGTPTKLMKIVKTGHCGGYDEAEGCTAEISVELVWEV